MCFKLQHVSTEWEDVICSFHVSPAQEIHINPESGDGIVYYSWKNRERGGKSCISVLVPGESLRRWSSHEEASLWGGGQLTRCTMDVPLPQGKGAWTRPCWRGCSCPWGHGPLTPHSPRPAAAKPPDTGVSAGCAPLQKAGLKRINFRYGPAGPVHFFPHITEVHGNRKLAWMPGDRAWRKLPAPAQTLQFVFL